ncbi:DUF438 domain-containing protein [Streptococcus cuniculi]|uniref:DUF438 domain-containing protein n=1 Tax=Streptococcus cuniculi TaxID=1432788 RepID=A0A4Y9JDZ1_9STRE|nr:DUF438 domain-containing protein [Streptococcus cuniculi]MBF0777141.1 DUF438 domain-containing protein [Streptococcus cuniculi]TFU98751.1 DUF438 domain-containing protein [Streptococcus cuniculi]
MTDERIHILKEILLTLHRGASPASVQERFNQTFAGVSAIEISLMEHELMNSDSGVTFEDVMALCDVHANLFKQAVQNVEVADADQAGHPVRIFKDENLALRAALIRVRRLLNSYEETQDPVVRSELTKGLERQLDLLGQFENHYRRKEELFFPLMEKYGHDAPPKVMWGVDDQIRDLFMTVKEDRHALDQRGILVLKESFEAFATEFESMIFKEESILLMILLECFTQDDWLQIARESETFGYAIIRPSEVWYPERTRFTPAAHVTEVAEEATASTSEVIRHRIDTPEGELTISFKPRQVSAQESQAFGNGYLSVEQANLILNHLPIEITFVNKDDIFQYYNDAVPSEEMIFKRTPSQIGRHVELCHPPKLLPKVRAIFTALREGRKDKFEMWFKSESRGQFIHVTYKAVRDATGEFQGVLEYVQDIAPYRAIDTDVYREIDE